MERGKIMPKVIMLLSNGFDPDPRVYNEATALIENKFSVKLICWDRGKQSLRKTEEVIDGISVSRVGPKSRHNLGKLQIFNIVLFWINVGIKLLLSRVDVIHCHDFDTLPVGFLLSRIKRCKLVYDAHENYASMIGWDVSVKLGKIVQVVEGILLKGVDLVLTVGDILREDLVRRGAKNTLVVGNWKDPKDFTVDTKTEALLLSRLGLREKKELAICYITNLKEERQIIPLMDAVAGDNRYLLILGGRGPLEQAVWERAKNEQNITYVGFVHPKEIPQYVWFSDIVFYGFEIGNQNSKYSAPNKLFEALAAGKIIISCDFGEIGRIVAEHKCGILIASYRAEDIRKALDMLSTESNLRETLSRNALEVGSRVYCWEMAKQGLVKAYKRLINYD